MPYTASDSDILKGFAGAAGRIEGSVQVLTTPEEGEMLQAGEILVASTTNVGWTPLFPRAAAIITDIGAPLSPCGMLKGYTLPHTPGGTSCLAPAPPWHYVGNALAGSGWIRTFP